MVAPQPWMPNGEQTAPSRCISFSVQFTMLKSESKIQSQPIVDERDRRGPRQDDQEAHEPLAAEVADEEVREDRRGDDDDRLRRRA